MQLDLPSLSDTIVAAATPAGQGAIAIVRLSGPAAFAIGRQIAPPAAPRPSHRLQRARLRDQAGQVVDDAMVVEMHAPHSYTGEDLLEFHVHGSPALVDALSHRCCALGARLAQPGEFTQRAYLRGKMDLCQAEAVADLIASRSDVERQAAVRQLGGGLSEPIGRALQALTAIAAAWNAALDFPEEPTGPGCDPDHQTLLADVRSQLCALRAGAVVQQDGHVSRVCLCGPPNAGKSTLLNAWAGHERALVDAAPHTTRDVIDVSLVDDGQRWLVSDTAGLDLQATGLDARGVAQSHAWAERADWVVWLLPADSETPYPLPPSAWRHAMVVRSKADVAAVSDEEVARACAARQLTYLGSVSRADPDSCRRLRLAIWRRVGVSRSDGRQPMRLRHVDCLERSIDHLGRLLGEFEHSRPLDALAVQLREAMLPLSRLLGRDADTELLDQVFSSFCIGK